jgi:hypothetical protein
MQTSPLLGKIFEIDRENPLHRKKSLKLPWKSRIFEKQNHGEAPKKTIVILTCEVFVDVLFFMEFRHGSPQK